jgi:hypothetical protein
VTAGAFIVVCLSVWGLFQIAAVLIGWRLAPMRARAVVEWQDCDRNDPPAESVWDSLDRHLHDVPGEVLVDDRPFGGEHEADLDLSEENEAYADDFLAWASELGQRAS